VIHACHFISQAASGLQHAHEKGLVHRDIKPSNLMLTRSGGIAVIKVLDFGLAKASSEGSVQGGLTHSGQMLGTPYYMAPEQSIEAQKADIRADIYSLGCTLYYLLAGNPPFDGTSLYQILDAHQKREATRLDQIRSDVPWEVVQIVARMMAKDPAQRFQSPAEVTKALAPYARKQPKSTESTPTSRSSDAGAAAVYDLAVGSEHAQPPATRGSVPEIGPSSRVDHNVAKARPRLAQVAVIAAPVLALALAVALPWKAAPVKDERSATADLAHSERTTKGVPKLPSTAAVPPGSPGAPLGSTANRSGLAPTKVAAPPNTVPDGPRQVSQLASPTDSSTTQPQLASRSATGGTEARSKQGSPTQVLGSGINSRRSDRESPIGRKNTVDGGADGDPVSPEPSGTISTADTRHAGSRRPGIVPKGDLEDEVPMVPSRVTFDDLLSSQNSVHRGKKVQLDDVFLIGTQVETIRDRDGRSQGRFIHVAQKIGGTIRTICTNKGQVESRKDVLLLIDEATGGSLVQLQTKFGFPSTSRPYFYAALEVLVGDTVLLITTLKVLYLNESSIAKNKPKGAFHVFQVDRNGAEKESGVDDGYWFNRLGGDRLVKEFQKRATKAKSQRENDRLAEENDRALQRGIQDSMRKADQMQRDMQDLYRNKMNGR
jgi:serine/threonine protein kinase